MSTNRRFHLVLALGVLLSGCMAPPLTGIMPASTGLAVQNHFQASGRERRRERRDNRQEERREHRRPQPRDPQRPPRYQDPIDRVVVVPQPDSPKFIRVDASDVTGSGFTLTWITDQPTVGMVEWGESGLTERSERLWPPDYEHTYKVTGLKPGTTYQYRITAVREGGGGFATSPTMAVTTGAE